MEQSEIYRLYLIITLTLEKSYSMVTAAHMIRYRENFNNRTLASSDFASAIKVLKQSNIDAIIVAKAAQAVINQSSTEIRRCEPSVHERGVTYDRFYQLYGSYIGFTYEHFLTPDATDIFIDNSLDQNSRKFLTPINDGLWGYTSQNLTHLLANRCQVNESISEITHFYDENDEERFYHHVQVFYKDGSNEIYGKLDTENNTLVVKHFENPFRSGKQYCLENCSSLVQTCPAIVRNSVRHVSLVPVEASPGHVITGIRWRISEKILYMEIQEGKYDNESFHIHTVHWKKKPIEEIIYEAVPIGDEFAKGFIMDDVKLPTGCLLSGVQFVWNSNLTQGGDLIRIKIQGKRWSANMTDSTNCIMESNPENITRIELSEPDASEFAPNNEILSKPGDYVIFQSTDMKKDVAQSSVPYFDIQSIKKKLHLPLSGIGLYYKGMEGFGGFIALRAFAAEMSSLINPEKIEIYADTMTAFIEKLGSKNITAYTKSLVSWDSK